MSGLALSVLLPETHVLSRERFRGNATAARLRVIREKMTHPWTPLHERLINPSGKSIQRRMKRKETLSSFAYQPTLVPPLVRFATGLAPSDYHGTPSHRATHLFTPLPGDSLAGHSGGSRACLQGLTGAQLARTRRPLLQLFVALVPSSSSRSRLQLSTPDSHALPPRRRPVSSMSESAFQSNRHDQRRPPPYASLLLPTSSSSSSERLLLFCFPLKRLCLLPRNASSAGKETT